MTTKAASISRRTKKTVPKPATNMLQVSSGAQEEEYEEREREGEMQKGFQLAFSIPTEGGGDAGSANDSEDAMLIESSDNYRRFSSRVRHKTDFYVPTLSGEETDDKEIGRGGRRRRVQPVVRRLDFDKAPLVVAPPDVIPEEEIYCQNQVNNRDELHVGCNEDILVTAPDKEASDSVTAQDVPITPPPSTSTASTASTASGEDGSASGEDGSVVSEAYPIGSIVWGKLPGYDWWPGIIISYCRDKEGELVDEGATTSTGGGLQVWVKWYGENNLSQIPADKVVLFSNFVEYFNAHSLKGIYKKGVFMAIKEAARRCKYEFNCRTEQKSPHSMIMDGSSEIVPISTPDREGEEEEEGAVNADRKGETAGEQGSAEPKSGGKRRRRRRAGRGEKGTILLSSLEEEMLKWALNGFPPAGAAGLVPTSEQDVVVQVVPVQSGGSRREEGKERADDGGVEEKEPPKKKAKVMLLQVRKKAHFDSVLEGKIKISEICLACGALEVYTEHPLFEGGLCKECKDVFLECTYLFDDDGTQMYCCICSAGDEVFMCDTENCAKVYCDNCIRNLCGAQELERVTAASQWLCYMCCPESHSVGLLTSRHDWDRKLQELFLSDHEMECDPPPTYPPISPESRKPINVLALFDGIGTGLLVLKELGIEVDTYAASEVDTDAIQVSRAWHHEISHIGNISKITEKEIQKLGPFDLVIGGSPCNDLSIVNPARRGIYEGTGRLFFEFFRILSYVRFWGNGKRPLFWLYENVVTMRAQDKHTISRFLQCNPVVVDAKDISATHRARYFWGNIPGMNRALSQLPGDKLTLQDCLEPNCSRFAQFRKLRTITTKMNSIKQTKAAIYPVLMAPLLDGMEQSDVPRESMQGDVLWCTEMERLFGFPDHYTDVANLGRSGRQRLLGKAWSVPVLRHILSPLKDYFKSNTTRDRRWCAAPLPSPLQSPHTTTQ